MTAHALTLLIVLMGAATVLLSAFVAWRFWRHHNHLEQDGRRLSVALVGMLMGEMTIGLITLTFAFLAWQQLLPGISIEVQSLMRFIAFLATSTTTIHLALVVERLNQNRL